MGHMKHILFLSLLLFFALPDEAQSMDVFGDSIAAGNGVSQQSQKAPNIVGASRGLSVNMHAVPGATSYGQGPVIYSLTPTTTTASTYMIGTNEASNVSTTAQQATYKQIIEAEYLWLLIPNINKSFAQSLAKTGTWINSTVNPSFGLQSTTNGSTLTATVFGSTVYIGLWATLNNAAVVNVTVDGAASGPFTPATTWTSSDGLTAAPYAVRIAGLADTIHTVVLTLTTANSSTLFVDYIAGNAGFVTPNGPVLFASNPAKAGANSYVTIFPISSVMQTAVSELASDKLQIYFVDTAAWCLDACHAADGTHPDAAGQLIIANAWMSQFQMFPRFTRLN